VYPKPVLERMEPSIDALIDHVEQNSDYREPTVREPTVAAESEPGDAESDADSGDSESESESDEADEAADAAQVGG
jgi:NADH-quinone oxidoreductase subunit M